MELNLSALNRMNAWEANPALTTVQSLPIFQDIDPRIIESLVSGCPIISYEPDTVIISEWSPSDGKAYIIISGSVDVYIGTEKVSTLSEGAIFGEYALICQENRSATVRAEDSVECLIITESHIMQISDESNKINDIVMERISQNTEKKRGIFA